MNTLNIQNTPDGGAVNAVIYGTPGIGKTTLAASIPSALIVDTEAGARFTSARRVTAARLETVQAAIDYARDTANSVTSLVMDTVDMIWRMAERDLCAANGWPDLSAAGYGAGYAQCAAAVQNVLRDARRLTRRGVHVIYVSHAQSGGLGTPDTSGILVPRLAGAPAKQAEQINYELVALADAVGYVTRVGDALYVDWTGQAGALGKARAWQPGRDTAEEFVKHFSTQNNKNN